MLKAMCAEYGIVYVQSYFARFMNKFQIARLVLALLFQVSHQSLGRN